MYPGTGWINLSDLEEEVCTVCVKKSACLTVPS